VLGRLLCIRRDDYIPVEEAERPMVVRSDGNGVDTGPSEQDKMMRSYTRLTATAEWRQLAVVLDKLFFFIFTVMVILVAVILARKP
jgi:hypothetical protein